MMRTFKFVSSKKGCHKRVCIVWDDGALSSSRRGKLLVSLYHMIKPDMSL